MLTTTQMFACFHFNCRGNKTALEDILEKSCESEISEEENIGRDIVKSFPEVNFIKFFPFLPFSNCYNISNQ
jgi:hypothetical protein